MRQAVRSRLGTFVPGGGIGRIVCAAALGAVVTLVAAQVVVAQRDGRALDAYAELVLEHAELVASASVKALDRAAALPGTACTPEDLANLRRLAIQSHYVRDIGRVVEGAVGCSASWGVFAAPSPLPPPDRRVRGFALWHALPGVFGADIAADMVARDGAVVTTSPIAFDRVSRAPAGMGVVVSTRDGKHLFQRFGDTQGLTIGEAASALDVGATRLAWRCSTGFDICVSARKSGSSVLVEPWWFSLSLAVLGALAGAGIALVANDYRERRRSLLAQLRRAIDGQGLSMVYQPIRSLSDRQLLGVEALARWRTEDGREIPPDRFVPLAERDGLGTRMAKRLVSIALGEMAERLRGNAAFYLSINLTSQDLLDAGFRRYVHHEVRRLGLCPDQIVLELTERATADHHDLAACMLELKSLGYRFYVDDFGTGYSNFAYLTELPITAIKMDRRFTRAIGTASAVSQVVQSIAAMAAALELDLIVEGVETEEQASHMLSLVPDGIGQGWLLGRPVASASLPAH
ncbi:EAL domain-containing protein [Stenotrophomonas sp. LGBM10]|uniref:EAL domain-containing protein n=1 Tax=Stenotrophomonas sp. LGBM10 TaxID=3390038 RepID=UPI00398AB5D7